MNSVIKVGQKVQFDPARDDRGFGSKDAKGRIVTATVVYVNTPHKWFCAEYPAKKGTVRRGFKFWDIGRSVTICG